MAANPNQQLGTSEIARLVPCRPRDVSDLFYARLLPEAECRIVAGRRLIPTRLIPKIRRLLADRAKRRREAIELFAVDA